ncbi:hypothetical protein QUA62_28435 [Microcoleus sp. MON1_C1]|uniref:hypothetical protein n=1 Tax=Microcoleus sp. MON1_C1 TaxID=2818827 RepID=UPI002FD26630
MPHSADCPEGRSQLFTFARRDFLQKAASAALPFLFLRPQPAAATPLNKRPSPEFAIGDLVAQDWEGDEDEDAPQFSTDFGEVVGLCYVPKKGSYLSPHVWVYYIYWTRSTSDCCSYPCFDGEPTVGSELRLVSHA